MNWGWVVCVSFLILFTLSAGVAFSFNQIVIPLNKEIHSSLALLVWLGTLPTSLPLLLAPCATALYNKIGTRTTVIIGVFVTSTALAFTALSKHVATLFIVYGVFGGSGITLVINPPFFLLDEYFPYHHPRHVLATSVIACAFPAATLLFNPISYALLSTIGWRATYTVLAVAMFVVGILVSLTFKPKTDEKDLCEAETMTEKAEYDEILLSNVTVQRRTKTIMGAIWFIASIFKAMGYYTPFLTLVKQMEVLGISQSKATTTMMVVGACEIVSRLTTSFVGDYIKGKLLYTYVIFCFALSFQNGLASLASTYVHLMVYGVGLGILGGPVIAAMYSTCSEVIMGQDVHEIFTVFRVGLGIGSIIGPTIAGVIYDNTRSFQGVYFINCSTYAFAGLLYATIIILNKFQPKCVFPEEQPPGIMLNHVK